MPMQKIQMVKVESRDDGLSVNIITCSGAATEGDEEKRADVESLIRKPSDKKEGLNPQKEKETFIEAKKDFAAAGASTSKYTMEPKADDVVKPFLQACIK